MKDKRANTVDPDEITHYEPSHLDLYCCFWRFTGLCTKKMEYVCKKVTIFELHHEKKCILPIGKTKAHIRCTAHRLLSTYVFPCLLCIF